MYTLCQWMNWVYITITWEFKKFWILDSISALLNRILGDNFDTPGLGTTAVCNIEGYSLKGIET